MDAPKRYAGGILDPTTISPEGALAIPAGRLLDLVVAERVMDWRLDHETEIMGTIYRQYRVGDANSPCGSHVNVPCWSTSLTDAQFILDILPNLAHVVAYVGLHVYEDVVRFSYSFQAEWVGAILLNRRMESAPAAPTLPLAICRLALLATQHKHVR